jgi:hypothetical protein
MDGRTRQNKSTGNLWKSSQIHNKNVYQINRHSTRNQRKYPNVYQTKKRMAVSEGSVIDNSLIQLNHTYY